MSFGPRTLSLAASTVSPSSDAPSIVVDDVARLQARLLGGRPRDRGDDREPAVRRRSVVQVEVAPAASTVPIVAPIPSNSPEIERGCP